ncbi:uncharacterized protein LOC112089163 [Eutrema salsugineum]|uniref:uncharacterized protein LOC112089163 n=1 Tax=Eutrema salsugineum TaxID=72664 RepID=UPI000CED3D18|nr:uncharacterized protein LOC112089163 [Eutrema salsugineum]
MDAASSWKMSTEAVIRKNNVTKASTSKNPKMNNKKPVAYLSESFNFWHKHLGHVNSSLLDKAALDKRIGYHPECAPLALTHLCFADDLLVFVEGEKNSIVEALAVFDDFAKHSGLRISIEKSTVYMAGITAAVREDILSEFPFEQGVLPVRYLGLPLTTRKMTKTDYIPLLEKIQLKINTWTARALLFGDRLQLIRSVFYSLINYWMAAFRLPKACIREIDKICAGFLWSGQELNGQKAKVAWDIVCSPKKEGGLDLKPLDEVNKRLSVGQLDTQASDQANYLLGGERHNQFRVMDMAKDLEVSGDGKGGCIDLGISINATLGSAMEGTRRRRHRNTLLQQIEEEIRAKKGTHVITRRQISQCGG